MGVVLADAGSTPAATAQGPDLLMQVGAYFCFLRQGSLGLWVI